MNLPLICIKKPVLATVLSLLLIVFGIMGYQNLHTQFFPHFDRNSLQITTQYSGASAELIENDITTPIEKAISGIEGIEDVSSTSTQGVSNIHLKVAYNVNLYDISNKIRNQLAMITNILPSDAKSPVVQMGHEDMDLMDIGFSIQNNNLSFLRNYLDRYVINSISQLPGISNVQVFGATSYVIRITLNPEKMNAYQISAQDVTQAINNNSLQLPAGSLRTPTMNIPITAKTQLHSPKEFEEIVVKNIDGKMVYLKDIATISLGPNLDDQSIVKINGKPGILLSVFNATDANPIDAAKLVRQFLKKLQPTLPSDIQAAITFDQSYYMKASISEVYKTIAMATGFVAFIIFFTLGKIRAALIPIITIPVCLLATMGFMDALGFSINIITLLAIVLSIGLVVDDAIVVLENIERHIEQGMDRLEAAIQGSREITIPIIAMTLTLAAVYAPIGFIKGNSGISHIFASFAFTLSAAVLVSGFVALTLSPMMCSRWLTEKQGKLTDFTHRLNTFFCYLTDRYRFLLSQVLMHRLKIIITTLIVSVGGFFLMSALPKTFMPDEDMGFLITVINSLPGSNNQTTENSIAQLNQLLFSHHDIQTNVSIASELPTGDNNNNMIFSTLKPYEKRTQSIESLAAAINQQIQQIPSLNAHSFAPSFGGSMHQQISFYIMAPTDYKELYNISQSVVNQLKTYPGLQNPSSNITFNNQQYELTVNRQLAANLQVPIRTIDTTLAALLGGITVSSVDIDGQSYDVIMQADSVYLSNLEAIKQFQVPSLTNQFISLGSLVQIQSVLAQPSLLHYNGLRAALISAQLGDGYQLGEIVHYLQNTLPKILSNHAKYAFTGQAERIIDSSNTMLTIFLLAFVFIYLVLSAQFESFLDPFIILLAVPLSIIGAIFSLKIVHGSINLYTMIGLVSLVGLIAKHGILITQFANTLQTNGKDAFTALQEAAAIRLRPILMTTAAMIFGALPLIFSSGASANSREQIGVVIVGGLLFGTFFSLILVPIAYSYIIQLKQIINRLRKNYSFTSN